jgi:protein phosphatase 2C family protein 2/3
MTKIDKLHVEDKSTLNDQELIIGPLRVFPGKLSVTRTLGDIEAKDPEFEGIPNCISFEPEIAKFTIDKNDDFLFLGCDGIFEKLESI